MSDYPYNVTAMLNSTNLIDLAKNTNTALGGYYFGYFILIIVFVVIFVILKGQQYASSTCFAVACWVNFLVALLLRGMGLLDNWIFWLSLILAAVSAGMLYLSGNYD
jgi:hypothetical protein